MSPQAVSRLTSQRKVKELFVVILLTMITLWSLFQVLHPLEAKTNYERPMAPMAADIAGGPFSLAWTHTSLGFDYTRGVAWGDANGDGQLDLAVANGGNYSPQRSWVFVNNGGTFSDTATFTTPNSAPSNSVAWGDFDGDGRLDLAFGNGCTSGGNCSPNRVYRNTTVSGGPLGFALAWTNSFTENTTSLVWGDVDGDGRLDLVAGNYNQPVRAYRNNGTGGFDLAWTATVTESTRSVALADYDGDGRLDIAVGNDGLRNRIYQNTSSGSVSFSPVWTATVTESTYSVAWGDMNSDGAPDLAVGNRSHPDRIYRNDSGPNTANIGFIAAFTSVWTATAPAETLNVVWGDYNGDGKLDLATISGLFTTKQSQVYRNDGLSGDNLQMTLAWSSLDDALGAGAWGDANGDGTLDLAMGGVGVLRLYRNQGLLLQPTPDWTSLPNGYYGDSAAWGDVDNDGRLDLAVGNRGGPINVYRNVNGRLTTAPVYTSTQVTETQSIAWGDWNGDGYLDLAVGNGNFNGPDSLGQVQLYRNDQGALTSTPIYAISELADTVSVAWCDIDRDGKLDLVIGNTAAPNRIYRNDTPALSPTPTLTLVWTATETIGQSNFVCGDIDNDGLPDLATGYRIYHNDGTVDGLPQMSVIWTNPIGGFSRRVALGDMDGDGFLDLAVGRYDQATQVFHNNGGAFSTSPVWESAELQRTYDVAWGDLDGDGRLDLAVANAGLAPSRVYHNEGGILASQATWETPVNLGAFTAAWGDVDGDGDLDLFFGNTYGGHQIYYNSRAARTGLATTPYVSVVRPAPPGNANFYSAPPIWTGPSIPLTFTLLDARGSSVRSVQAHYSPDGGGTWLPALPYTGTRTTDLSTTNFYTGSRVNNTPVIIPATSVDPIIVSSTLDLTPTDAIADIKVRVNLTHTWDSDLIITLTAPSGQSVLLFNRRGGSGDNLGNTVFDDSASTSIGSGLPPYSGSYRPEQVLGRFDGLPLAGTWTLRTQDVFPSADGGTLLSWGMTVMLNSGRVYTYAWDIYGSGFLGQSDDVLFRLDTAPAIVTGTRNAIPGPYQYSQSNAATFPFRVRGTQIQVANRFCFPPPLCRPIPLANAIVYRLPYSQTVGAELIADAAGQPYHTDSQGYLQGRGELNIGDRLFALAPITATESYRLYQTNGTPNAVSTDAYTVTSKGVQVLYVSTAHPLYLFDLDVSLEWDAHNDSAYLDQLKFDLQRASAYLHDFTNGQMALGNINVYQNADNWAYAHIIIRANNRLRPFSAQGGIVISDTVDPQHNVPPDTIIYSPGQIAIGSTWNRYGRPGQDLGDDWPIILAHELGHYVLYHDDTYLGLKNGQLVAVDTCKGSAMGDLYTDPAATEFIFDGTYWLANCRDTLAEQTLHRNEWQTMKLWYPRLISPTAILSGPTLMPFDLTPINIVAPMTPTTALADPTFYLNYQGGGVSSSEARAFLMREDSYVYDLGSPFGGQNRVLAHGAQPGDRLCVFDRPANQFGCEVIEEGDDQITMKRDLTWNPIIQLTPVNSTTLNIRVESVPTGLTLQARLFPEFGSGAPAIPLTLSGDAYLGTILLTDPTMTGHIQVWVNEAATEVNPRRETIVPFSIGGNPGAFRGGGGAFRGGGGAFRGGGGAFRGGGGAFRGGGAPVVSPDGQMIFFTENPMVFQEGQFYTIQGMAGLPAIPPGRTVIGQGYRLSATPGTPVITGSISIQYLSNDILVAGAAENGLTIYFYDGIIWRDLSTIRNSYFNLASAPSQGTGIYALMSSIQIPLYSAGWNLFAYPLQVTQTVATALESIQSYYNTVYGYYAEDVNDPWKLYQVGGPTYLNDLTALEPGRGYWISATQAITVHFSPEASTAPNGLPASPPSTFYGAVLGNSSFVPTAGMTVEARINGNLCGRGKTQLYNTQIVYVVDVDADDQTGRSAGCGQPGRQVTFTINDQWMSPWASWDNNQPHQVTLSQGVFVHLPLVMRNGP